MAELRELVAQQLIGDGSHPWEDRVVETSSTTVDLGLPPFGQLPFVVVRQVATLVDVTTSVPTQTFEVWIHAPNISFAVLDGLERLAIGLIDGVPLTDTGSVNPLTDPPPTTYLLSYGGTLLGDQVIDVWDAYARGLRFTWTAAGIGTGPGAHDDPRAAYLRSLGLALFQCYGTDWCVKFEADAANPPTDDCPLVWVRPLTGPQYVNDPLSNYWVTWYSQRLAVHVICPTSTVRDKWIDRVSLGLPRYIVGPEQDSWFLTLLSTDYSANPEQVGQIIIEVRFGVLTCPWQAQYPPFKEAVVALPEAVAVITPPPSPISPRPDPILIPHPSGGSTP